MGVPPAESWEAGEDGIIPLPGACQAVEVRAARESEAISVLLAIVSLWGREGPAVGP